MLTQTLSLSNGADKGLRDPSFSSYLTGAEQNFVLNLVKQCKNAANDDDEIGVFSADKYFNERLDEERPKVCETKMLPNVDSSIKSIQSMNESRAMSVRSGSSRSSQSALLKRAVRQQSLNGGSKVRGRGYLGSFRCRCVCSDHNSVAVEEYENCRDSLALNQRAAKEPIKKGISPVTEEIIGHFDKEPKRETYLITRDFSIEDLPRKSLEVFGLPVLERRNKDSLPFSFDTDMKLRLNMKDQNPRQAETVIPAMANEVVYPESDSDASSDLFEIEHLSTGKVNPFLSRQVSRNMSGSATPTAGYAPSEASIAWSVGTASAADFPITSDYEELKSVKNSKTGSTMMNKKVAATGDNKARRLSSSFLACNSHESVTVVDRAHKTYEKISDQNIVKSQDLEKLFSKPQTEAMRTGFEPSRNMRVGISSRSVAVSNSIHGSNMLYLK